MTPLLALLGTTGSGRSAFAVSRTYLQIILSGMPLFFTAYIMNYFLRNDDSEKAGRIWFYGGKLKRYCPECGFVPLLDGELREQPARWQDS